MEKGNTENIPLTENFLDNIPLEIKIMKTYKVLLKQAGEGCDYTIACGQEVITIEAENYDEAIIQLKEIIADEYNTLERKIETAEVYEVVRYGKFDINYFYEEFEKLKLKKLEL